MQEEVVSVGKLRPSAVSINQPSKANYWAASMEAWPTEPCNPHIHLGRAADLQENGLCGKKVNHIYLHSWVKK